MVGKERREQIIDRLKKSSDAISGFTLASDFNVSRQIIVQDIALIRTSGHNIISTHKGYLLMSKESPFQRVFKVRHEDNQIEDEMNSIIDLGGHIEDVFVSHKVYGLIRSELNLRSRYDVSQLMIDLKSGKSTPLKNITDGYHYHTITASSSKTLDHIFLMLKDKGYLVSIDDWDWQYVAYIEK